LLFFGSTLFALAVAAVWFALARSQLTRSYDLVSARRQELAEAQQRLAEAQLRVRFATAARELVNASTAAGYVPAAWGERRINIRQNPMMRPAINDLLGNISRNPARIFGADDFELSVTRAEDGLFDMPSGREQPLLLTLHGALLFRTQSTLPGSPP
jgi:hypothetical protein